MALPAPVPVTTPVVAFTNAIPELLLLQVPPLLPFVVRLRVDPVHTAAPPLIVPAFKTGFTVMDADWVAVPQVVVAVYVIIAFPAAMPVTRPVAAFTVATAGLLLLQLPVPVAPEIVNGVDKPAHTVDAPVIVPAFAVAFTVTL